MSRMTSEEIERRFHEEWLGLVQPVEGLVVSVPVLTDAQCSQRNPPTLQHTLIELAPLSENPGRQKHRREGASHDGRAVVDLEHFFSEMLQLTPDLFDCGSAIPEDLSLYVPEGGQTLRPTLALKRMKGAVAAAIPDGVPDDSTPATRAGAAYEMLVWDLCAPHGERPPAPVGISLDQAEAVTGSWEYPPTAKLIRLLRACRVPIGLLTNRTAFRLIYAPHGQASGHITFRVDDMASAGGRPLLDAFVMLLCAQRFFGVREEHQLPQLLRDSRLRQADVTNQLARQVFEALGLLLRGFETAAEREKRALLDDPGDGDDDDHVYSGLLTVLLRLVFLVFAEDRGLLPVSDGLYQQHLSVLQLFAQLQDDRSAYPDSMSRRYGAWPRLLALFRAVYFGVCSGDLRMPARHGDLFDPRRFPFLEGWLPPVRAPIEDPQERGTTRVPTVDDETVLGILERLLILDGQRLSYRSLDVEQIGSVYEALMGYHVRRLPSQGLCLKPNGVWICSAEVLEQPAEQRLSWIEKQADLEPKICKALGTPLKAAKSAQQVAELLESCRVRKTEILPGGRYVLQPGPERRRTSSHYTPRSLSEPIVRRTLEPLLMAMGETPSSEQILNLKVCDPAMGSGAFLVAACRFLGDQVVAAWTREAKSDPKKAKRVGSTKEDVVTQARRLVAQRCLYGVDRNPFAVNLAKLALWMVTLARDQPFTFLDHALRCGDSLVGVSDEQFIDFHWAKKEQLELCRKELKEALNESLEYRLQILELADKPSDFIRDVDGGRRHKKEELLANAEGAIERARLIADLLVGAWFAGAKAKEREAKRNQRLVTLWGWLSNGGPVPEEFQTMQSELRRIVKPFHWSQEFPEVFQTDRQDPLNGQATGGAMMDAFVGNPPFLGGSQISGRLGDAYLAWVLDQYPRTHGNADYSAYFFRRAFDLLGTHGALGLIATNTIAQGDTRSSGLQWILAEGGRIFDATRSMTWPGEANVAVSVVHIAKGSVSKLANLANRLDGHAATMVSSRLLGKPERPDPIGLTENARLSYLGSKIYGNGFLLLPEQRAELLKKDPRNGQRIFPYIGGEEVNTSPAQSFDRYVINFGDLSLEEAGEWPDLLRIVREEVKPERDKLKDNADGRRRKKYWWQFGRDTPALYESLRGKRRALVTSRVTKHLVFSFLPANVVFSERLYVFPVETWNAFVTLQSRAHEAWARLLSSTLRNDLNYAASDCFETFPFPQCAAMQPLERLGQRLYETRAKYMVDTQQGLTQTYNLLKDPTCTEQRIVELRRLHEEADRAVLCAYDWKGMEVPPFEEPTTEAGRKSLEAFKDEVIDRLFELNEKYAKAERIQGVGKGNSNVVPLSSRIKGLVEDPPSPITVRKPRKIAAKTATHKPGRSKHSTGRG